MHRIVGDVMLDRYKIYVRHGEYYVMFVHKLDLVKNGKYSKHVRNILFISI